MRYRGILRSAPTLQLQCRADFSLKTPGIILESPQQYLMQRQYGTVNHKQLNQDHCIHIALDISTRIIIMINAITVIGISVFVLFLE